MQFGLTFYPLACVFLAVIAELAFRLVGLAGKRLRFPFGLRPFQRGRRISRMRTIPTTREITRLDRMVSPSIQVIEGLILPRFDGV